MLTLCGNVPVKATSACGCAASAVAVGLDLPCVAKTSHPPEALENMRGATDVVLDSRRPAPSKLLPPSRDNHTSMLEPDAAMATAIVPFRACVAE
jgi:hypothetical protein